MIPRPLRASLPGLLVAVGLAGGVGQAPPALAQHAHEHGAHAPATPAVDDLRLAWERNRRDPAAGLAYGDALLKAGKPAEARAVFNEVAALPPDTLTRLQQADLQFQLGQVAVRERRFDDALAQWALVLRDYGDTPRVSHATINTAAVLYQVKDENDRAFDLLQDGLRHGRLLDEHLPTAHYLLFSIEFDRKHYAEARAHLERIPPDFPRLDHAREAIPVVYFKTGDPAKGRALLDQRLAEAKTYLPLNNLAAIFSEHDLLLDEALTWAERANELSEGKRFFVLDTLASLLFKNGQVARAIEVQERAVAAATQPKVKEEYQARLETYRRASRQ